MSVPFHRPTVGRPHGPSWTSLPFGLLAILSLSSRVGIGGERIHPVRFQHWVRKDLEREDSTPSIRSNGKVDPSKTRPPRRESVRQPIVRNCQPTMATRRRVRPFTFLLSAVVAVVCLPWTLVSAVVKTWWKAVRWGGETVTCRIRTQPTKQDTKRNVEEEEIKPGKPRRSARNVTNIETEQMDHERKESDVPKGVVHTSHTRAAVPRDEGTYVEEQDLPRWETSYKRERRTSDAPSWKNSPVVRTTMAPPYSHTTSNHNPKKNTLVRTWCIASVSLCLAALSTMAVTRHLQVERKLLLALGLPVAWLLIGSIGKGKGTETGQDNHTGTLLLAGTFSWFVVGFVACVLIREGLLMQDETLHCEGAGDLTMLTS